MCHDSFSGLDYHLMLIWTFALSLSQLVLRKSEREERLQFMVVIVFQLRIQKEHWNRIFKWQDLSTNIGICGIKRSTTFTILRKIDNLSFALGYVFRFNCHSYTLMNRNRISFIWQISQTQINEKLKYRIKH